MGQLRIETVARLLVCEPAYVDLLIGEYAKAKTSRWQKKYPEDSNEDLFEHSRSRSAELFHQFRAAKLFMSPTLRHKIADQSPVGAASVSDGFAQILRCQAILHQLTCNRERVEAYDRLLHLLVTHKEPIVRNAASKSLLILSAQTPTECMKDAFLRPLTVAACLRFPGTPSSHRFRRKVRHFIKTHFSGELLAIAPGLKSELNKSNRGKTSELLSACHAADVFSCSVT